MFKRYLLTPFILTLAVIMVVSGCFRKENKPQIKNEVKEPPIATMTENQQEEATTTEEVDMKNWKTYQNKEYGFEIDYPVSWYLYDCSNSFIPQELSINFSNIKEDTCNIVGGSRIGLGIGEKNSIDYYKRYNNYQIKELLINNKKSKQVTINYEVVGGEGEKLPPEPMKKVILTYIPHGDNFIVVSYSELYKIKEGMDSRGFKIEKDYSVIYNKIVGSFKLIDN